MSAGDSHPDDRSPSAELLAGARDSWGELSVLLQVGSHAIELAGLSEALAARVESNYPGFVSDADNMPTMNMAQRPVGVELLRGGEDRWLSPEQPDRIASRLDDSWIDVWGVDWAGRLDREARFGRLLLCDDDPGRASAAIDCFLRYFTSTAALRQGGALVHAAALQVDGRSTVTIEPGLAPAEAPTTDAPEGAEWLGDRLVLLESGRNGQRACGVPFRPMGDDGARISSACAPIDSVQVVLESGGEANAETLLPALPFLLSDPAMERRALEILQDILSKVEVNVRDPGSASEDT
jgi:hypothetical protein